MISVRDGSGLAAIGSIKVRDVGGLAAVSQLYIRDAGGLHPIFSPMSVEVVPNYAFGSVYSAAAPRATTNSVTAVPSGGTAPYTVEWTFDAPDWEAINPTLLSTAFRSPHLSAGSSESATATCTVTDANGNEAFALVSLSASNEYAGP